jgi:hypothetical protein
MSFNVSRMGAKRVAEIAVKNRAGCPRHKGISPAQQINSPPNI